MARGGGSGRVGSFFGIYLAKSAECVIAGTASRAETVRSGRPERHSPRDTRRRARDNVIMGHRDGSSSSSSAPPSCPEHQHGRARYGLTSCSPTAAPIARTRFSGTGPDRGDVHEAFHDQAHRFKNNAGPRRTVCCSRTHPAGWKGITPPEHGGPGQRRGGRIEGTSTCSKTTAGPFVSWRTAWTTGSRACLRRKQLRRGDHSQSTTRSSPPTGGTVPRVRS